MPKCQQCHHFYPEYILDKNLKGFTLLSLGLPEGAKERPPLLSYCSITQCPRCNPAGELMKLTEAIRHAEMVVVACQKGNPECAEEHDQLARWLIELRYTKNNQLKEYMGE